MTIPKKLKKECDANFIAAISGRRVNVLAESFCVKQKIIDFLKDQTFPFYVTPDLEASIRGLPISNPADKIKKVLIYEGLDSITIKILNKLLRYDKSKKNFLITP